MAVRVGSFVSTMGETRSPACVYSDPRRGRDRYRCNKKDWSPAGTGSGSSGSRRGYEIGDTIHACGMIAFGPDGNLVGEGDCYAQAMQVYRNIAAVLALEGASMADIVKTTTWLPDMSLYQDYARARAETFPGGIPCSSTLGSALVLPRLLIEIEAIAVIGSGGSS